MNFKITFLFTILLMAIGVSSCGDDDPIVEPNLPRASFAFEVNDLEVSFTSTSVNATSYVWDFGDGNTGTGESVTHTYEAGGDYTVQLKASNADGENETSQLISVVKLEPYHTSGFLLTSFLQSSAGFSTFASYFSEAPTGNVDLTQYQSFPNLFIRAQYGPFMYGRPSDNVTEGVAKFAVNKATNQIEEIAVLPTINNSSRIVIINEELGFFSSFLELKVYSFNPTTMTETGVIDLSVAPVPAENNNGVSGLFYNEKTGKIVATIYSDNPETGQFYDDLSAHLAIIDLSSQSLDKFETQPEATYPIFRGEDNAIIDEAGNMYFIAAGSYGLDNQIGPTANKGSRPQILKLNTSNELEVAYAWNPINAVGLENNFFQIFTSMVYAGNGKAYGIGTAGPESQAILGLLQKLATNTITEAEFDQLRFLVFADESQRVIELDLTNQTAQFVEGIPLTAGFAYPYMYARNGKVYAQMTAEQGTLNGYYEIDVASGASQEMLNISQGGFAGQFRAIGSDNE